MPMKLDDLRLFHLVVESQSFTRAAELADLPVTNVSRRIKALEVQLQVTLLARTTRQLRVTDAGEAFYHSSKATLQQFEQSIELVRGSEHRLQGKIRIQVFSGASIMVPTMQRFQQQHPNITIDLVTSDRELDLVENNFDLAIRLGPQRDSNLVARNIGWLDWVVVASPNYIKNNGKPQQPEQLSEHNCIRYRMPNGRILSQWQVNGEQSIGVEGNIIVNELPLLERLLLQHHGVGHYPIIMAQPLIDNGCLEELFPLNPEAGQEIWLVYSAANRRNQLVKHFVDFLFEQLDIDPEFKLLRRQ
ncbi:LysR family transcriptional regulator [Ferrimonas lipolytica]|uniref:LysR family transcriptional regulator n=1 Tax=Ferrimonas lipolytica TaxID=2724191 RepID=A0A6H1UD08_9GAMM|nr:LysR family transcriptional regulator [Ferrimonas lipolytica]QIZ76924.1 LysR family transcriptional regulator [Ferrimonas lipolytica]